MGWLNSIQTSKNKNNSPYTAIPRFKLGSSYNVTKPRPVSYERMGC